MANVQQAQPVFQPIKDFLPINGTDYIEFYVGNAKQAAHYYRTAFGFRLVAYAGLETGVRDKTSYVLQQDKIRFVLTTPLLPEHSISDSGLMTQNRRTRKRPSAAPAASWNRRRSRTSSARSRNHR
jgi:4-hydroxyphenylpyruvate dioxygenase-like putative hemolysin